MKKINRNRISIKLIAGLSAANVLTLILILGFSWFNERQQEYQKLDNSIPVLKDQLIQVLTASLLNKSLSTISETMDNVMENQDIYAVYIENMDGEVIEGRLRPADAEEVVELDDYQKIALFKEDLKNQYFNVLGKLVDRQGHILGYYYLYITDRNIASRVFLGLRMIALRSLAQALIGLIITFLISLRIIVFPINALLQRFKVLSESGGDLKLHIRSRSNDEIGKLAFYINNFIQTLAAEMDQIQKTGASLESIVRSLDKESQTIAATSNEQAASAKEIASTMEDTGRLSHDIYTQSLDVLEYARNSSEEVDKGVEVLDTNIKNMQQIKSINDKSTKVIEQLEERITYIQDWLSTINSIANQTKIIAFNAELEANAAGKAGKNFEIVASEIRRLADSTIHFTSDIQDNLLNIENSMTNTSDLAEENSRHIEEGWQQIHVLKEVFKQVQGASEDTLKATQNISVLIKQNSASTEQVIATIKAISQGINGLSTSMQGIAGSSRDLKKRMLELEKVLLKYYQD